MRIGIMGAGAIGCNVGGMLTRAGHDVTFIDQWPAHVEAMNGVTLTKLTTNLFGERWSKMAANCMSNPLAGLSGYGTAEVRTVPVARRIAIQVAAEVVKVADAAGHQVEPIGGIAARRYVDAAEGRGLAELEADMVAGAATAGEGRPSLLQDVMRGRRTEIEDLNGLVVAEGKRLGVPTPFNEAVVREVVRHGVGTLKPSPANLAPLAAMLGDPMMTVA